MYIYFEVRLERGFLVSIYLEVGLERGKMTGGEGQFSAIVVKTSSVNNPPHPDKPYNVLECNNEQRKFK